MTTTTQEQYVDLTVCGVNLTHMKVMPALYKGRCCNTGKWFDPSKNPCTIAFKHKDQLSDEQKKAIFGTGAVYHVTVLMEDIAVQQVKTLQKKGWTASVYQSNILDKLLNGPKHLFIEALAGSGKTSTLVWLVKELQSRGLLKGLRVLYMAFNKAIQEELTKQLLGTGCPAMTTHGFGFQILKQNFKELEKAGKAAVQNSKTSDLFLHMLAGDLYADFSPATLKKTKKSDHYKCRKAVLSLVGFIKNWAVVPAFNGETYTFNPEQKEYIKKFFEEYEISVPEGFEEDQILNYACTVTAMGIPVPGDSLSRVSYDDMLYLPLALGLTFPKYGLVLTDESQDFNEAQEQFLFNLANNGARVVVCGDENQALYRFRGADSKAFRRIKETLSKTDLGVDSCDLPINYRSDEAIIEHARQWVPKLEGRGTALGQQKGEVSYATTYSQALQWSNNSGEEEFCYLCRINVPLVVTAYQLIAQGKRVCIIGRQAIASPMINLIEDLCGVPDKQGNFPEHYTDRITNRCGPDGEIVEEGLLSRLNNYYKAQSAKLSSDEHVQALEDLQNNVDCIEIIAGRVKTDSVKAVIDEIDSLFTEKPDDKGTIKLSTVHRAKGLEWDTVLVICPHLMPHPNVKPNPDGSWSEDQQVEENLQYVCATRARHKLHYICNWPFGRGKGTRLAAVQHEMEPEEKKPVPKTPVPSVARTDDSGVPNVAPVEKPVVVKEPILDDGEPF